MKALRTEAQFTSFRSRADGSVVQRFNERWMPEPFSGCWLWTGRITRYGYGRFAFQGRDMAAHRLSWYVHFGEPSREVLVCHRCDTPLCVNPDHLFLGSQSDNMKDCHAKGRLSGTFAKGQRPHNTRLTPDEVIEIRARLKDGERYKVLMSEFNVGKGAIDGIKRGKNWRTLK